MSITECASRKDVFLTEQEKGKTLVEVREIKPTRRQAQNYFLLLTDPDNAVHFTGVPDTLGEFMAKFKNPSVHVLVGLNELGEEIGYATLTDAEIRQNDHYITHLVVSNELQSRSPDFPTRMGTQLLEGVVEHAFTTLTYDGRVRKKLYMSVVDDVPNAERARRTVIRCGFEQFTTLREQSDVLLDGELVTKPSQRFELFRSTWETRRNFDKFPTV